MGQAVIPRFANDVGVKQIKIGVKEFKCIGAKAPFDHPHVYLDMGQSDEIICPYCSTLYVYDSALGAQMSEPAECIQLADHEDA